MVTGRLELPESPHLYMLATNLSEGSLCAFCREGLILQRRSGTGSSMDIQTVQMGLATVPMAVAASSAFPVEGQSHSDQSIMPDRLDGVFVSDAGATFKVRSDSRAGGVLRTALRSTDILMDRVNQLELEAFANTPGAVFFPITRLVEPVQDPTAMHPEIQKQVALIRTDLDRFSDLEISTLIQHGYCVARQLVRETPHLPGTDILAGPPWDPLASRDRNPGPSTPRSLGDQSVVLPVARRLQRSSVRRFLPTLFSARDWPTYVWLPLIALTLLAVPTVLYEARRTAFQQQQVLSAIAKSSPLYGDVLDLLQSKKPYRIPPIEFEQVDRVEPLDFTGYDVISDDRIYDLRGWTSSDRPQYAARMHARFQVLRTKESEERPVLRIQLPSDQETMQVEYLPDALIPTHVRTTTENGLYLYQTSLDFSRVPVETETTLVVRQVMPVNMATQEFGSGRFRFTIAARTGLARIWVLPPRGRLHDRFGLYRYPLNQTDKMEIVHATTSVEVPTGAIATFELINLPEGYRYECRWRWIEENI
jgi:hypothetical protein